MPDIGIGGEDKKRKNKVAVTKLVLIISMVLF